MKGLSDAEIVRKIKDGDIEYFSYLVKKYTQVIAAYVAGRIYDVAERDDIVQESFLSFYKAINRFDESRPVLPYLYEITKNEMKMYFRAHKQTVSLDERIATDIETESHTATFEMEETTKILDILSDEQKNALQLLYEGYSYQEVANRIGKQLNTTKTIIRRARLKLNKAKDEQSGT